MPPLKFELIDDSQAPLAHSGATIALLPAGGVVWEDFLDSIGVSLEAFCREGPGGWMLGYIDALATCGVRTVLVFLSRQATAPIRYHDPGSGSVIVVLPVPARYLALRKVLDRLRAGRVVHNRRLAGIERRVRQVLAAAGEHLAVYLSAPLRLIAAELQRHGCGAILVQEYEHFRFDLCVALGRWLRLPVFATFQGGTYDPNPLGRALRPFSMRACAGLFIAPQAEIERVRQRYGLRTQQVAQIFNPVDIDAWDGSGREAARTALGLSPATRVAVWHGRVSIDHKGLDVLLETWDKVCRQRPDKDLRLLLMGTGQDAQQLRRHLEERQRTGIQWIDQYVTDRAEIRRFLSAGDVYLFPSRYEGFAVAPIEAMACGLPVVATEVSGIPDIFSEGEEAGGVVVPIGDTAALAEALGKLLDDPEWSRMLGQRARSRVEHNFTLEAVGRQLRASLLRVWLAPDDAGREQRPQHTAP